MQDVSDLSLRSQDAYQTKSGHGIIDTSFCGHTGVAESRDGPVASSTQMSPMKRGVHVSRRGSQDKLHRDETFCSYSAVGCGLSLRYGFD